MSRAKQVISQLITEQVLLQEMPEIVSHERSVTHGRNFVSAEPYMQNASASADTVHAAVTLIAKGIRGVTSRRKSILVSIPRAELEPIQVLPSGVVGYDEYQKIFQHPLVQAALEQFKQKIGFYDTRSGPGEEVAQKPEELQVRSVARFSQLLRTKFPEVYFMRVTNSMQAADRNHRILLSLASKAGPDEKVVKVTSHNESASPIYMVVDQGTKEKLMRTYAAGEVGRA
jgi:hypothetical protein